MVKGNYITETCRLLAEDYCKVFSDNLISVILYGSAVTPEYVPKKSDLNFMVVFSEEGIEQLYLVHPLVAKWRRKRVSTPLFLTKAYIESSLDTFPIEFLNIKQNYRVVYGEDVLERLSFQKDFVRMQCERELKGKLLLLRERYAETRGKAKALKNLIAGSVPTFIFVFKGLLYLLDKEVPATKHETISMLAKELHLDQELHLSLLQVTAGTLKPSAKEIDALLRRYLKEMRSLTMLIDRWEKASPGGRQ
jgi:predicted nucleotidyltransferase